MELNKLIKLRKKLEKKYTRYALYFDSYLPCKNNRIMSISPTSYWHNTGINANGIDMKKYKDLSEKIHQFEDERQKIEKEIKKILKIKYNNEIGGYNNYFFQLKDFILSFDFFEFNTYLQKERRETLKKIEFNRIVNLLKKWSFLSQDYHYKVNNAEKRISKKIIKREF